MKSFSNISSGTKIYTASDTFDGSCLIGPTVPFNLRKVKEECLVLENEYLIKYKGNWGQKPAID
jgi:hypothetical protein